MSKAIHPVKRIESNHVYVAVSGGVDSMVALHLMSRKHEVTALHYVHAGCQRADEELAFVVAYCRDNGIKLITSHQVEPCPPKGSNEDHWRKGRYAFFNEFADSPVVTGHTLDDAVEWYIFSACHGMGKYMEYANGHVIRPLLLTKKERIISYATRHNVPWVEDSTNADVDFAARNRIRHLIVPEVLKVNPGIHKVVAKRIRQKLEDFEKTC